VASAYAVLRPQDSLLLLTGSLQTSAYELPANLDYVKLPAMPKREVYASLPPTEGHTGSHNSTIRFRTALALTKRSIRTSWLSTRHPPVSFASSRRHSTGCDRQIDQHRWHS
jgi:hypothetical protein